jgi:chromosome segregation ATPase
LGARDILQNEIDQLRAQNDVVQRERTQVESERTELKNTVASMRDELGRLQREQQQLQSEANTLTGQCAQLERERREIEDLSRRERTRLQELSAAAQRAGHADLADRISEIYLLLPQDKADEGFIGQPTHPNNQNQRRAL